MGEKNVLSQGFEPSTSQHIVQSTTTTKPQHPTSCLFSLFGRIRKEGKITEERKEGHILKLTNLT